MSIFTEYTKYDGLGLAELVRKKEVTPEELVDTAIERIEKFNPQLNAVIYKMYDYARDYVKRRLFNTGGPFAGVPFLLKDLISTFEGVPTGNGNKLWKNIPAVQDSEMVCRWKKSGMIILGKTNTPEFGLTPYTEPLAFGPSRNPWDTTLTTGGSSGGSAAAVAARLVPLASGGDGGGSIRIPCSACGLFGLKTTRGRMPSGPEIGETWHGFAIEHVLTRSVRDSAAMLDATQGMDVGAPYFSPPAGIPFIEAAKQSPGKLKIAFTATPMLGKHVDSEVLKGLESAVQLLKELGHEITEAAPEIDSSEFSLAFMTILAGELRSDIEAAARAAGKKVSVRDFDPATFGLGMLGKALSAESYASAARYLQISSRKIVRFFEDYDVLLTPVLSSPPVPIGSLQPTWLEKKLIGVIGSFDGGNILKMMNIIKSLAAATFAFMPWTPVFNVTGQPAMSVPLYWTEKGLPVGMHFVGKFGDEATLIRLAGQLEKSRPWFDKVASGYE
jgi:amidase